MAPSRRPAHASGSSRSADEITADYLAAARLQYDQRADWRARSAAPARCRELLYEATRAGVPLRTADLHRQARADAGIL